MSAATDPAKDAVVISRLRRQLAEHVAQIKHLKRLVTKLQRMHFGPRSERWIDPDSVGSGVVAKSSSVPEAPPSSPVEKAPGVPRTRIRRDFPDHLSRESVFHPPETAHCPDCGGRLKPLGEDVSEILEYVPASFKVVRHIRPKLACACCDHIAQAPAPSRPIPRSFAGPALLAHIMVGKYCDHLPLYRQSGIGQRSGIILSPSTLGDWVGQSHHLLTPLVEALRRYVFLAEKLHADDTPIRVLAPGEGKTRIGRLWTYVRDDRPAGTTDPAAVWLAYSANRKGEHPQEHLKSYQGILQADAYAGYNLVYEQDVQEAACWAHVRRKFFDIYQAQASPLAGEAVQRIGALYALEAPLRGKPPDDRLQGRIPAKALLEDFHAWLLKVRATLSQKSDLSGAMGYALNQWAALIGYVSDGRIEIDNNAAERSLRAVALGRKNFLFAGSDTGGERAAAFYSLIGTAKLNGMDPEAYLSAVLARIVDHPINRVDELLPWNLSSDTLATPLREAA